MCSNDHIFDVTSAASIDKADDVCWICLDGNLPSAPLVSYCNCPSRLAHSTCLSRWQLQSAGKSEERRCRFCSAHLPDWREAHQDLPKATPIMTVVHDGRTYQVSVEPGPRGREEFLKQIRDIFGLEEENAIQLTFGCKVPGSGFATGQEITLEGWDSFDAAVHCASLCAGQRIKQEQQALVSTSGQAMEGSSSNSSCLSNATIGQSIRRLFTRNILQA